VMLLHRNPAVSTWAVLLCVLYPTWETLFSMYRRNIKQKVSSGDPDSVHFHHLVLKVTQRHLGHSSSAWQRHGVATAIVWVLVTICQIAGNLLLNSSASSALFSAGFGAAYLLIYSALQPPEEFDSDVHEQSKILEPS
jgi:UDP-GlcNAc:undecaprenyl-phosphate GlcNAc-1-phosphate transferase